MSITSHTEKTPKFTSMDEMKRWQAEREDRLHSEHVRARILQFAAEREAKNQRSAKSTQAAKKPPE